MAHCVYCQERSGVFSRVCKDCRRLIAAVKALGDSYGYRTLLEGLMATAVSEAKIQQFLDADPDGSGSLNDQVTARMTNELMGALGQSSEMKARDVRAVKERVERGESYLEEPDITHHSQLNGQKNSK